MKEKKKLFSTDWAAKWAVYRPDKPAIKSYENRQVLTYAELNDQGQRLAGYFLNHWNLKKGDRIAVLAEFSIEYVLLFVAAQKTGVVLVPLNYRLTGPELDFMLKDSRPNVLLYEDKFSDLVKETTDHASISFKGLIHEAISESEKEAPFSQALTIEEHDPIFILYTSGTTGFPKGSIYTHGMLFWNSINTSMSLLLNAESRTINCMPPFHTGGWNVLLSPLLHHGGYCCLVKKFDAAVILQLIEDEKPSLFMAVPTMLKMLAEQPAFSKTDLSSLLYLIVGGEAMPIPLIEAYHAKGIAIRQGYGMTEVGPNLTSLHQDDAIRKKGSIGFPNFYLETKIVNDQGEEARSGQAGELRLRGPVVSPGYWGNEQATQKAFADGWFCTGDRVMRDEEGYLFVVDRIKNMFISGGENVYPAEVERVLLEHPDIQEVAVIGVPHAKWGEVGHAFIACKKENPESAMIQAYCQERLAKFKVPKHVTFLSELPKNGTGKIDRNALKNGEF